MTATALDAFAGSIIDPSFEAHVMNSNLFDRLERSILDPTKTAIATPTGETISYADLIALSGRLANVLAARGAKPGDRVAPRGRRRRWRKTRRVSTGWVP